jgi:hypothetical protein
VPIEFDRTPCPFWASRPPGVSNEGASETDPF